jgi:hypothetical protein
MRSRTSILSLLLVLLWGMTAALHPCGADAFGHEPGMSQAHASDHCAGSMSPRSSSATQDKGCCDPPKKQDRGAERSDCEKACQSLAVLGSAPVVFRLGVETEITSRSVESPVSLLTLTVDHIPLA